MSVDESVLKPDEQAWIYFREGILNALGGIEQLIHGRQSRIYWGRNLNWYDSFVAFPYFVQLNDINKLEGHFPGKFHAIDEHTMARIAPEGGLQIKRINNFGRRMSETASFSPEEYRVIRLYAGLNSVRSH